MTEFVLSCNFRLAFRGFHCETGAPFSIPFLLHSAGVAPHPFSEEGKRFLAGLYDEEFEIRFEAPLPRECRGPVELEWDGLDGSFLYDVHGRTGVFHGGMGPLRLALEAEGPLLKGKLTLLPQRRTLEERAALAGRRPAALFEPLRVFSRLPSCFFGWDWAPPLFPLGVKALPALRPLGGPTVRGVRLSAPSPGRRLLSAFVEGGEGREYLVCASVSGVGGRLRFERAVRFEDGFTPLFEWEGNWPPPWEEKGASALVRVELDVFFEGERVASASLRAGLRGESPASSASRLLFREGPLQWGANYVEPFFDPAESGARPERLLATLRAAGGRWVRVWGGGRYASEAFLDRCDELGLNVWQDMPFACACAPVELDGETYLEELRRFLVRAARHPSLAVLCGGNENEWLLGKHRTDAERDFFLRAAPAEVERLAPHLLYRPDSPWGGREPNDPREGDRHEWGFWSGGAGVEQAAAEPPVFASEFGFQSRPLVREDMPGAAFEPGQYQEGGTERLESYLRRMFGEPPLLDEPHASRWCQAEALGSLVRAWMLSDSFRGGLVWQLNDPAPAVSWSLVDHFGVPKPALGALAWAWRTPSLAVPAARPVGEVTVRGGTGEGGYLKLTFPAGGEIRRAGLPLDGDASAGRKPVRLPAEAREAPCCRAEVFLKGGGYALWEWWNGPPAEGGEVRLSPAEERRSLFVVLEADRTTGVLLESFDCVAVPAQNPVIVFPGERRKVPLMPGPRPPLHVAGELLRAVPLARKKS